MARQTYVMRGGKLVEKHLAAPVSREGSGPFVISDNIDPLRSMADGRIYDSKSRYYASVRDAGCEIVGNERAAFDQRPDFHPSVTGHDIKAAIEQLRSR